LTTYADRRQGAAAGKKRTRRTAKAAERRPLAGGVLWIVLLATLLAGVVAVNVAVLQLTMSLSKTSRQRIELQGDVARLQGELSSAASTYRLQQEAHGSLGLVQADSSTTRYVELAPK
jgi:cell division protein FtsL